MVARLTGGLAGLAKQRKVTTIVGTGRFTATNMLEVTEADGSTRTVSFDQAIIAAGSEPVQLPFVPHDDPRVIDSTGALALERIPEKLLVLGGGIIGLEMATVYAELGIQHLRRRADGPDHPRRGRGHRQAAAPADLQGIREHLAVHQGHRGQRGRTTG